MCDDRTFSKAIAFLDTWLISFKISLNLRRKTLKITLSWEHYCKSLISQRLWRHSDANNVVSSCEFEYFAKVDEKGVSWVVRLKDW